MSENAQVCGVVLPLITSCTLNELVPKFTKLFGTPDDYNYYEGTYEFINYVLCEGKITPTQIADGWALIFTQFVSTRNKSLDMYSPRLKDLLTIEKSLKTHAESLGLEFKDAHVLAMDWYTGCESPLSSDKLG